MCIRDRRHLVRPNMFGHSDDVEWRQPTNAEGLVRLRHAEVQHAFCQALRHRQRELSVSQKRLAEEAGFAYSRLNDCINGVRPLNLMDIQRIEAIVGPILFGLRVRRTVIVDEGLRERFPLAVGRLDDW